jgi:PiT family inorganic phosphate transporter
LSPFAAVVWAGFFNFVAYFISENHVSSSIAKGVAADALTLNVIFGALLGAIAWNLLTWWKGLPSSSSHALMGAFAGSAMTRVLADGHFGEEHPKFAGQSFWSVLDPAVFGKVILFIVLAPMMGGAIAFVMMKLIKLIFASLRPHTVDRVFRRGQLLSAALYSLGHGGNDAQKTMGIIMALLTSPAVKELCDSAQPGTLAYSFCQTLNLGGPVDPKHIEPYGWVALACYLAMGIGTMSGGWRIVKTMGMKITKLKPVGGFAAETSGAITLALATNLGVPVSTTHTISGAILGTGISDKGRLHAVRWGVAGRIVWAWIITIPASAIIAALSYILVKVISGMA